MHVIHVVRQYRPMVGGLEEAVAKLSGTLVHDCGIRVSVVTLDRPFRDRAQRLPAREVLDGVEVRRIPFTGSTRYPVAPAVLGQLKDADIVHVHAIDFFFDFLALTRRVHGKPLVASTHGGFFHTSFAGGLKKIFFRQVTRRSARAYQAICASSRNDGEAFATIAPDNTRVIENGVDTGKWRGAASGQLRKTIAAIGRFSTNKGLIELIDTLRELRRHDPEWRLLVIGQESDLTAADLTAEAARAGVADAVELTVGADDVTARTLLGCASYFASASKFEGFGLAAVEAMSAGLYPLLSPIPPYRQLLAKTGQGELVDFGDPGTAATTILDAHSRLEPRAAEVRQACIAAAAPYAWPSVGKTFADLYADILAR